MTASPGMDDVALYKVHVRLQAAIGAILAVALLVVHPAPAWAFGAVGVLGISWGVLTYVRLRAEHRAR